MATTKFARLRPAGAFGLVLGVALVLSGCGGGVGDVSGKVASKGKPVVYGTVTIMGQDGIARVGTIQTDGSYTVKDVAAGPAKVMVDSPKPNTREGGARGDGARKEGRGAPKDLPADAPKIEVEKSETPTVPAEVAAKWFPVAIKYSDQSKTPLNFTIRKGPNTFDIEIEQ